MPKICSAALSATLLLVPCIVGAADAAPSDAESAAELMTAQLIGARGKEVRMITVTYAPGGASMPHRHDAQVFVYVLEGEITMQNRGSAPVTLKAGQTFYEGPNHIRGVGECKSNHRGENTGVHGQRQGKA